MTNISVQTFKKDIVRGSRVEYEVLYRIRKKYPKAYKVQGFFKGFDLYIPEVEKSAEVKFDERSSETGNFFIECAFNGEPSGIETTEASYYVIVNKEYMFWIEPQALRLIIQERQCRKIRFPGQDGTIVEGYLLPVGALEFSPYVTVHTRKKVSSKGKPM